MEFNSTIGVDNGTQTMVTGSASTDILQTTQQILDCGLPPGQCDVLRTMQDVINSLSIAVLLLAFICIFVLRKYRLFHERIICQILLADLLSTITTLCLDGRPEVDGTSACTAQGFFLQLFSFAELMWLCNLTIFIYLAMIKSTDTSKNEGLYTATAWLISTAISCIPLITDDYGLGTAPYCWISSTPTGNAYRIALYWAPAVLGVSAMVVAFIYMFWHARKAVKHFQGAEDVSTMKHKNQVKDYLWPLAAYAGAFLVLNLILFINRALNARGVILFGFLVFHVIIVSAYGLILTGLFVLTNGRKEFTKAKFVEGYRYYVKLFRDGRTKGIVEEYSADNTPAVTPRMGRREVDFQVDAAQAKSRQDNHCLEVI